MTIEHILFYAFSLLSILFSFIVIASKNPIHSILSLVLVFFNTAGLMILLGVEFLALLFLIVYVGAVAVLFLFVIMMLNIKIISAQTSFYRYLPFILLIFSLILFGTPSVYLYDTINLRFNNVGQNVYYEDFCSNPINNWTEMSTVCTNITLLGNVIYTNYSFLFILSGVILLVSMLGAISLTLHRRNDVRRQFIYKQIQRNFDNTIIWKN